MTSFPVGFGSVTLEIVNACFASLSKNEEAKHVPMMAFLRWTIIVCFFDNR